MTTETPPYLNAYGNIEKVLDKIIEAPTPDRFTQDFLSTKLGITSSGARPIIPFLKRLGFLGSDGVPKKLYKQFRNSSQKGAAAAGALKEGYKKLYGINEYLHDVDDKTLHGIVLQATGLEKNAPTAKAIVSSFGAVKKYADFASVIDDKLDLDQGAELPPEDLNGNNSLLNGRLGLSYTINLNLPATSDIKVFDAIFKSLKENLLK